MACRLTGDIVGHWLWIAIKKVFAILTIFVGLGFGYIVYIDFSVQALVFSLLFICFGIAWLFNKAHLLTKVNSLNKIEGMSAKDSILESFGTSEDIDLSSVTIWGWLLLAIDFFVFLPMFAMQLHFIVGEIYPAWDGSLFIWWLIMTLAILVAILFFLICKSLLERIGIKILKI